MDLRAPPFLGFSFIFLESVLAGASHWSSQWGSLRKTHRWIQSNRLRQKLYDRSGSASIRAALRVLLCPPGFADNCMTKLTRIEDLNSSLKELRTKLEDAKRRKPPRAHELEPAALLLWQTVLSAERPVSIAESVRLAGLSESEEGIKRAGALFEAMRAADAVEIVGFIRRGEDSYPLYRANAAPPDDALIRSLEQRIKAVEEKFADTLEERLRRVDETRLSSRQMAIRRQLMDGVSLPELCEQYAFSERELRRSIEEILSFGEEANKTQDARTHARSSKTQPSITPQLRATSLPDGAHLRPTHQYPPPPHQPRPAPTEAGKREAAFVRRESVKPVPRKWLTARSAAAHLLSSNPKRKFTFEEISLALQTPRNKIYDLRIALRDMTTIFHEIVEIRPGVYRWSRTKEIRPRTCHERLSARLSSLGQSRPRRPTNLP